MLPLSQQQQARAPASAQPCCLCDLRSPSHASALFFPPRYEREAKDKNRESWYMAYIMDTNEEERAKVGRAQAAA